MTALWLRRLIIAAMALGLAACNTLSGTQRPFQPSDKSLPIAAVEMPGYILIGPVVGAPAPYDVELAKAVAQATTKRDLIASTSAPAQRTSTLKGTMTVKETVEGPIVKTLWTLADPDGAERYSFAIIEPIGSQGNIGAELFERLKNERTIKRLAELTADEVAGYVKPRLARVPAPVPSTVAALANPGPAPVEPIVPDAPSAAAKAAAATPIVPAPPPAASGSSKPAAAETKTAPAVPEPAKPEASKTETATKVATAPAAPTAAKAEIASEPKADTKIAAADAKAKTPPAAAEKPEVYFLPIMGAPGNGRTALAQAFRQTLASRGVRLAAEPGPRTFLVQSVVSLKSAGPGLDTIEINWNMKAPTGEFLGNVHQSNQVPRGSLDGEWGPVAFDAADGAAQGIVALLAKIYR